MLMAGIPAGAVWRPSVLAAAAMLACCAAYLLPAGVLGGLAVGDLVEVGWAWPWLYCCSAPRWSSGGIVV